MKKGGCLYQPETRENNIVILLSGNGTNLQAIIDAIEANKLDCKISLVISNKSDAIGLTRAKENGILTRVIKLKDYPIRSEYDFELADIINDYIPSLVVLAGFMHILSSDFLDHLYPPIINLHPALPGSFVGKDVITDAYNAYQRGEIKETGVMIHHVTTELDRGAPICFKKVHIFPTDTLQQLKDRIQKVEHKLIIKGIKIKLQNG